MAEQVLDRARQALRSEKRVAPDAAHIKLAFDDGVMTVEGEVAAVAGKRLALEALAGLPEVAGIVDRLRVAPAQRMGDREITNLVRDAFYQEPAFAEFELRERLNDDTTLLRGVPQGARGTLEVHVADGIVTLDGQVPGLDYKRLAGVLAWWVPGSRDVVNGIAVEPDEADSFDAIAEAARLALEKDPFVDAAQVRVGVRRTTVTLTGAVPSDAERDMAERDCWYVFGVDDVINRIEVVP